MFAVKALVLSVLLVKIGGSELDFPPGFKFGVASAAYQVEGAWNVSDKSLSIWDHFTHNMPEKIRGGSTGDIACDSYNLWKRDLDMMDEVGVHFYRFSISWSRLLPNGFSDIISVDGKKYYSDLIDGLLERGIEPMVTLYHWDLPLRLHKLGGWTNPLISVWFADYARVVFTLYGDRVNTWITINEPIIMCDMAYNTGVMPPGFLDTEMAPYLCNKHTLMAHAKAFRVYDEEFRSKYHGRISIASQVIWFEGHTKAYDHLAELANLNVARGYHAVYSKEGGWPSEIEKIMNVTSKKQGYPRSRLPSFTKEEIDLVKGTFDYFALNYYTSRLIRPARPGDDIGYWPVFGCIDLNAAFEYNPSWNKTITDWFYANPEGIRKVMKWLKDMYGDLNIVITENGYPTNRGLNDQERIDFHRAILKQILLSIIKDGVNVTGYTAWTLMDNFEWTDGYRSKFGLYEVDFTSTNKTRTPRASALFHTSVINAHSLNVPNVFLNDTAAVHNISLKTSNELPIVIGIVLVVVASIAAVAAFTWRTRRRNKAAVKRDNYTSVKTLRD